MSTNHETRSMYSRIVFILPESHNYYLLSQALYGFIFVVTCDGEVFFASRTVEQYLGFHQVRISLAKDHLNQAIRRSSKPPKLAKSYCIGK